MSWLSRLFESTPVPDPSNPIEVTAHHMFDFNMRRYEGDAEDKAFWVDAIRKCDLKDFSLACTSMGIDIEPTIMKKYWDQKCGVKVE